MITNTQILILLLAVLLNAGCNKPDHHKAFVEQHGYENFDEFVNRSFFIRSSDREGNPIIYVFDETKQQAPCGMFLGVTVDRETRTVKGIIDDHLPDSCNIDKETSAELAVKFSMYGINRLTVDSNLNVYVMVKFKEGPEDLIRFSDMQYKTEEYKDWKQVKGNWYEKKE